MRILIFIHKIRKDILARLYLPVDLLNFLRMGRSFGVLFCSPTNCCRTSSCAAASESVEYHSFLCPLYDLNGGEAWLGLVHVVPEILSFSK